MTSLWNISSLFIFILWGHRSTCTKRQRDAHKLTASSSSSRMGERGLHLWNYCGRVELLADACLCRSKAARVTHSENSSMDASCWDAQKPQPIWPPTSLPEPLGVILVTFPASHNSPSIYLSDWKKQPTNYAYSQINPVCAPKEIADGCKFIMSGFQRSNSLIQCICCEQDDGVFVRKSRASRGD